MPSSPLPSLRCSPGLAGIVSGVLFAVLGLFWSMSSPLMGAPDEAAQTVRAVAVAQGELRGRDVVSTADAPPGENRVDTTFTIPEGYAAAGLNSCFVFQPDVPVGCAPQPSAEDDPIEASTYIGTYPPAYYAAVGWPSRLLSAPRGLWAMRLSSIAASAVLMGVAVTACRRLGRTGLMGAGLLVATTPMTVYFASVINPTGLEIVAAIAVWAATLVTLGRRGDEASGPDVAPSTADVVRLGVAFVVLASIRPLSPLIAVGILVTVALMVARRGDLRALASRVDARITAVVMAIGLAASSAWVLWSRAYDSVAGTPIPGLALGDALRGSVDRLPTRLLEMIGYFAYREAPAPRTLVVLWTLLVVALVVGALVLATWRHRAVILALLAFAVAFNVVPEALSAAKYGYIWQGRYALPIAVGVPLLAGWVIATRARHVARWWPLTAVALAVAWAVGQALGQAALLRRNVVGLDNELLAFIGGTGWSPPLPPVLLWSGGGLAALAFSGWTIVVARTADDAVDARSSAPGPDHELVGATRAR